MIDFLLDPLSFEFMQRGLLISCIVGLVCAVFSCFLVLKGWSLMGDAVSHAVLPGIVLAYLAGIPLLIGAFISGLSCAVGTGYIKNHSRIKEDTIMGILFSGLFALGLVMVAKVESDIHLMHILFGNILGVSWTDIAQTSLIAALTIAVMVYKGRDFMLYCFDPLHARSIGLPIKTLHYMLLILLALVIVASLKAAGIILVISMLIAPGAIAFLLTKKFSMMIVFACLISFFCCVFGTVLSFHFDVATAPLIVVMQSVIFIIVLFRPQAFKVEF